MRLQSFNYAYPHDAWSEVTKVGTCIAVPYSNVQGDYQCKFLVFTQTAPPTGTAYSPEWVDIPIYPTWNYEYIGRSADGVNVYAWSHDVGSIVDRNPSTWADETVTNLPQWVSRHTRKQIEDLKDANTITLDIYFKSGKQSVFLDDGSEKDITIHWHNTARAMINFHTLWFPQGSSLVDILKEYAGYYNMLNNEKYSKYEEVFNAQTNDGGTTTSWNKVSSETFGKLDNYKRILMNRASLTFAQDPDYMHLALIGEYDDLVNDEVKRKVSPRLIMSIPVNIESASSIKYDARYMSSDGVNLNYSMVVNIHIDEEPTNKEKDDINITRPKDDDNHSNERGKNDSDTTQATDGTGTDTTGLLTTTYSLTAEQCKTLGQKLWTQDYYNVLKVQTDPIQNVTSVKAFPFSIDGTEQNIVIGDVNMQCRGKKVQHNAEKRTIGTLDLTGNGNIKLFNSYLDYAPFTTYEVFIPYSGFHELDSLMIVGKELTFDYIVDYVTGASRARCLTGSKVVAEWDCTMGIDIPLSATDRAQTDAKHLSNIGVATTVGALTGGGLGALGGFANGVLNALSDSYNTTQVSGGSPCVSSYDNNNIIVKISKPVVISNNGYNHTSGRPCRLTKYLKNIKGFTTIQNIDLTGIPLTLAEENELRSILEGGFYA